VIANPNHNILDHDALTEFRALGTPRIIARAILHAAKASAIADCPKATEFNKQCETVCNKGYKHCEASSLNHNHTIHAETCSKVQSQCMTECYAKAQEKCTGSKDSDSKEDSNSADHIFIDDGEILALILFAIGALLVKLVRVKSTNSDFGDGTEYQLIEDQAITTESSSGFGDGRGTIRSDLLIADTEGENFHSNLSMVPMQSSIAGASIDTQNNQNRQANALLLTAQDNGIQSSPETKLGLHV